MNCSRREFLGFASTLLTTSATVPGFLQRTAWAAAGLQATSDRVLIVLQLTGGNDGLNTVVPFSDENYRRLRPTLQLADAKLHKLDDRVGLHPELDGLKKLFDSGRAAVVQSVGYPNPNRSHFESMAIWHTAPDDRLLLQGSGAIPSGGWLARAIDARMSAVGPLADVHALRVGTGEIPFALLGCRVSVPSLADLSQLKHRKGLLDSQAALAQVDAWQALGRSPTNPLLQAAARSRLAVHATAQQIERISSRLPDDGDYPESDLAQRFRLIARLIRGGFGTSIYYMEEDGFDTHSEQLNRHANVLRDVGGALRAFVQDVGKHVPSRPVLVLVFSEFGRRLTENASQGTDHGTAAPVLLAGSSLSPGVHGPYPDLTHLVDGDPVFAVDFRQIYATVLEAWLGMPSEPILGRQFKTLDVLRNIRA
jgi:uncharacterized protein (DUF1501 family)